jgi:transcriptional regulator with XRE-family HTH domain
MSLAQRVRDYRYTKGWGPDELASRAAISRTALYQIESGKTELPRAGTLRRIALALDVSMDTLLGHVEAGHAAAGLGLHGGGGVGPRVLSDWMPSEGAPLAAMAAKPLGKFDHGETSRFASEFGAGHDGGVTGRERELAMKFHEVLGSPFGEAVARIVDETYRLLPQARVAGG